MQSGEIGVMERDSEIPHRPPKQVRRMVPHYPADGDEAALVRLQLLREGDEEETPGDVQIQCEQCNASRGDGCAPALSWGEQAVIISVMPDILIECSPASSSCIWRHSTTSRAGSLSTPLCSSWRITNCWPAMALEA